ncbi:HTH_48 domain-containing protein [Trichonephila clavipes]|nr:HTH_48 domain-containing protein [Trichonephila clavipes]
MVPDKLPLTGFKSLSLDVKKVRRSSTLRARNELKPCSAHDKLKNRAAHTFEIPRENLKTQCFKLLKEAFGDNCTSYSQIFEWHKQFSEDQEVVEDDECSSQPVTSRTAYVHRFLFDINGIIKIEGVPQGQTIKQQYYIEVLRKLRKIDPPYSPDLVPYDFYLFLKVKNALMGTNFQFLEEIKAKKADLLKIMTPNEPQHRFERWKTRIQLPINREGEYVEGD